MGIGKVALVTAAAAVVGVSPLMAAAPITPSVAKLSALPIGANLGAGARLGATNTRHPNTLAGAGVAVGVLAALAVAGGVVAATDNGNSHSSSP